MIGPQVQTGLQARATLSQPQGHWFRRGQQTAPYLGPALILAVVAVVGVLLALFVLTGMTAQLEELVKATTQSMSTLGAGPRR